MSQRSAQTITAQPSKLAPPTKVKAWKMVSITNASASSVNLDQGTDEYFLPANCSTMVTNTGGSGLTAAIPPDASLDSLVLNLVWYQAGETFNPIFPMAASSG